MDCQIKNGWEPLVYTSIQRRWLTPYVLVLYAARWHYSFRIFNGFKF